MKILFFAPHAAIWIHAFPEALVAEALRDAGHEILYVTCSGQLKAGCIAMSSFGVATDAPPEHKAKVCRRCEGNKRILLNEFSFASTDLSTALTDEESVEVRRLLAAVTLENFLSLEVAGIEAGRLALYEFLLDYKKSSLDFDSDAEWKRYLAALENTLYAVFAGKRLIESEAPAAIVVYNALYSVNRVICKLAEARGIPHYFMHAGGNLAHRLQYLMLSKGDIFDQMRGAIDAWPEYRDAPVDAKTAHAITDHFLELLKGVSVLTYSSPRAAKMENLRHKFSIDTDQKVLCATLSSYDERFAAETIGAREPAARLLFPMQADWMRAVIEYVRTRPDRYLIIRVHPREFPNKRENVKSAHAHQLEALLQDLPPNMAINWPADNLSLYDLAEVTDVFLNAWSSVGKEMSLLGIPVVLYSPDLPLYPADINYLGTTRDGYFGAIENALAAGWRYENIVRTYRWCAIEYGHMLIDISDAYKTFERTPNGLMERVAAQLTRSLDPDRQQRRDCRARPHPIRAQKQITALFESGADTVMDPRVRRKPAPSTPASETAVLRNEMKRLMRVMYPAGSEKNSRLGRLLADFVGQRHAA